MFDFTVLKKSRKSQARIGLLQTSHGAVETPALVPVATQAVVKTLTSEEVAATGSQLLIGNTLHLHLKPGERVVAKAGGLHKFMNWSKPLMTDSGGFQVFSFGFGKDYKIGKIGKRNPRNVIKPGIQPQALRITDRGVWFRSPFDGQKLFLGPKNSMAIQRHLGADIAFTFDECTPPNASFAYTNKSLARTHAWAVECLKYRDKKQALFGIVQGGRFKRLRQMSARFIGSLPVDGFGIGGEFGHDKRTMAAMIAWVVDELPEAKPRHLLGIGHPDDIKTIVQSGIDLFDCIAPTHYARHGVAFTSVGRLDLHKSIFLKDRQSLDSRCDCSVCAVYTRSYISHLFRAKEITGMRLVTWHNLWYFNGLVANARAAVKRGQL